LGNIYKEVCCWFGMMNKMPEAGVLDIAMTKSLLVKDLKVFSNG